MRSPAVMFGAMNALQKRLVWGALVIALLMIVFPPLQVVHRAYPLTDGRDMYEVAITKFAGWGFIAQGDIVFVEERPAPPKDPRNPTLHERFEAAKFYSLDELKTGKKRIAAAFLAVEMLVLFVLSCVGVFFLRTTTSASESPIVSQSNTASLIRELVLIGSVPKIVDGAASERFFWRPPGEGVGPIKQWDPRAREIGETLHRMGGGTLAQMRLAHEAVERELGSLAGHALSAQWANIGEQARTDDKGEVWFH